MPELDIRIAAFAWLRERGAANGGILPGTVLNEGFIYQDRRFTLEGPAGIWFPQGFTVALSITTALNGPHRLDDIADDGLLTNASRERDPDHYLRESRFRDLSPGIRPVGGSGPSQPKLFTTALGRVELTAQERKHSTIRTVKGPALSVVSAQLREPGGSGQ